MPAITQPFCLMPARFLPRHAFSLLVFLFFAMNAMGQHSDGNGFASLRMNDVNIHAVRHFLTNFSLATGVHWSREDQYFIASFHSGQTTDKAYYKINGSFAFCVKYYLQDALEGGLKSAIFKEFPGCRIMLVTELTDLDSQTFIVNIKTGDFIKTLQCSEDGIEITESIKDAGI